MICLAQDAEMMLDYCSDCLTAERRIELDRHVQDCIDCQQLIVAQQRAWRALDVFAAPEVSPDFDHRLYARIAQDNRRPAWRRWLSEASASFAWKPAAAGLVACAALVVGMLVWVPSSRTGKGIDGAPPVQNMQSRTDKIDMDQVDQTLEDLDLLAPQPAASRM